MRTHRIHARRHVGIAGLLAVVALALALGSEPAHALPDCNKVPTPPRCYPDWEPPAYEKTYRLQPLELKVIKTQDADADEVRIAFSANHRWSANEVKSGMVLDLRHLTNWRFVNTAQSLTLSDLDASADGGWWDPDDQLGFLVVHPSYADGSVREASFTDHGAHYVLSYTVHYEGCTGDCPS